MTKREAEILLIYCQRGPEIRRRAIADILFISINTLKTHQRSICQKLDTRPVNEATIKAIQVLKECPEAKWD